jgi:hypothetical protein
MKRPTPTGPNDPNGLDGETLVELRRLAREGRRQPVPPMPEGWYPHEPGDPFYELDWDDLHAHSHVLERHWRFFCTGRWD